MARRHRCLQKGLGEGPRQRKVPSPGAGVCVGWGLRGRGEVSQLLGGAHSPGALLTPLPDSGAQALGFSGPQADPLTGKVSGPRPVDPALAPRDSPALRPENVSPRESTSYAPLAAAPGANRAQEGSTGL